MFNINKGIHKNLKWRRKRRGQKICHDFSDQQILWYDLTIGCLCGTMYMKKDV